MLIVSFLRSCFTRDVLNVVSWFYA